MRINPESCFQVRPVSFESGPPIEGNIGGIRTTWLPDLHDLQQLAKDKAMAATYPHLASSGVLFGAQGAMTIVFSMFENDPDFLASAATKLVKRKVEFNEIERLRSVFLHRGSEYSVLAYAMSIAGNEYYFVANIAQNLQNGDISREDYNFLDLTHQTLATRIRRESIREKFQVPQVLGITTARDQKGKHVPVFLATFLPFTKVEVGQLNAGIRIGKVVSDDGNGMYITDYRTHFEDFIRAIFIMHKATNGYFSRLHDIEEGDWVGDKGREYMRVLGLTTFRGGVRRLNDDEIRVYIKNYRQVSGIRNIGFGDRTYDFYPFEDFSDMQLLNLQKQVGSYFS